MTEDETCDLKPGDMLKWYEEDDEGSIHVYAVYVRTFNSFATISEVEYNEDEFIELKVLIDLSTGKYGDGFNHFEPGHCFSLERWRIMGDCSVVNETPHD